MAEIPRAYAPANIASFRLPAPTPESFGAHALGMIGEELQRQADLEERQRLETYGVDVQTALTEGIINARTQAAATTNPDEYLQIYESELGKTYESLKPTAGGDPKRGLILAGSYNTAIRRESDNIAGGVIHRRLQQSQVNAQKAADLSAKQMADSRDMAEVQAIRDQYTFQLERTPFLDLRAQENLRNKQLSLYGHNLIDSNQLDRFFKEESVFARELPEEDYRKLVNRADTALTKGVGLSNNLKKATQAAILNEFFSDIENGKDPTEVWKRIEPRLAEEKVLDFNAREAFNKAWSSFHSGNGPASEVGLRIKGEFQDDLANIPSGRSIQGLVQKYVDRVNSQDDIDPKAKAELKSYFLGWRARQDAIGRANEGQARINKHEELREASRQVRAYFNPPQQVDPKTGLPPIDLGTIMGGETKAQRASRMTDQMAAEGDKTGDYMGAAQKLIEADKKAKAEKPAVKKPLTDAEKEMQKRLKEMPK